MNDSTSVDGIDDMHKSQIAQKNEIIADLQYKLAVSPYSKWSVFQYCLGGAIGCKVGYSTLHTTSHPTLAAAVILAATFLALVPLNRLVVKFLIKPAQKEVNNLAGSLWYTPGTNGTSDV